MEVSWSSAGKGKFEAEIQIKAIDRRGIVNEITHIVAMDKLSLNGINARKGKDSIVSINLLVEVNDTEELKILMKKLKAIPGVESIYRMTN
ncbi:ACT domain protein [Clostridioides difficile CD34]|uniref:GTP pyrophosphokinase n=1 Tax=Clostridioides difficile TaxID=1496 RepID=A0A381KPU5_CLODI|nr:ACT domain-containing protein [Clostridioides difficile]EQE29531.1 ACT domain protein [Clostridioides difficile CD34]OMK30430.1 hypothetical protein BER30_003023 [Clostridioides difficile]SUY83790.1 GTP pyrophosphokinase [Clostridioides difficile]